MDGMILAAGLGTRLGEITKDTPKAIVDVAGRSALERVARSLIGAGVDRLIINVHHHAESVIRHVRERDGFGVDVEFSREVDAPLETGGGLLHAAALFRRDSPFFLHNVDVLTDMDLAAMYAAHATNGAIATLAVSRRESSRSLLFDDHGLCGRVDRRGQTHAEVHARGGEPVQFAFNGIHVVSPALLDLITERGAFSILDVYMRLASSGQRIMPFDISSATWLEVGSPQRLDAARRALGG
jgi:N-acetyl-alpha-D-muramate 1-phosphate uridylyltransferase